jgi:ATP-dependent Clp protease ATP-binding subunit ClpA
VKLAPVVEELFAVAQVEASALRHDAIGSEHVLLALVQRDDEAGRALRNLGLDPAGVREEIRRIVGEGPRPETVFDADALAAIGVDLDTVRARTEATFGEGALERARRRGGSCGAGAFGVSPRLKQALQIAREATSEGTELTAASIAIGLVRQEETPVAQILAVHAISPERLRTALQDGPSSA